MFYLLLSGMANLHRVYYNLTKISTLTLEEEEEEKEECSMNFSKVCIKARVIMYPKFYSVYVSQKCTYRVTFRY